MKTEYVINKHENRVSTHLELHDSIFSTDYKNL